MTTQETAILIPVPEADEVVHKVRTVLDPAAARGIPAHVTLLYPFVPPGLLTPAVLDDVSAIVASAGPFEATLTDACWFDDTVLWLRPEPVGRFSDLTARLCRAFPAYPPYGGAFASSVPHLTIGQDISPDRLRVAEAEVRQRLPIRFRVERAVLMSGNPDDTTWDVRAEFPLGLARRGGPAG